MIITHCPTCDAPKLARTASAIFGTYVPMPCDECGVEMVIEVTRMDGTTYDRETFEEEILPTLDGVERIDHPSGEATVYGDPDDIHIRT